MPYAIKAVMMGAEETRHMLREESALPPNPLTTFVVGFSALNIYVVLAFYLSSLHESFKKYRIWLFISSFSYIINCFACTGRDGLIVLPAFYACFYIIFKHSINAKVLRTLNYLLVTLGVFVLFFLATFSISRFGQNNDKNEMYWGTIGYISQQPYVFDSTIKFQHHFHGYELRFPLVNRILGIPKHEVVREGGGFETEFGTMYAEFYSIGGWEPMLLVASVFVFYYLFAIIYLRNRRRYLGMLLLFTVYLYIELTGLFYCKAGTTILINIFYLVLSIIPLFVRNIITVNYDNNSNPHY